jgi:hypothetical protein
MRKVEQFELMRRDFEGEGLSVRAIAGKYGVHRRKVREAIELSVPPERKVPARGAQLALPQGGAGLHDGPVGGAAARPVAR